jgi:hypothetical protein
MMSVGASDDPYKKYWVLILIGFILTGGWLCMPIMETSVGSTHVDTSKPAVDPNAAQSLDSVDNPSGAQGFSVSMDGLKHKMKSDEPVESMLYTGPADAPAAGAAAAGAPLGSSSGSAGSLAQRLKDVGDKNKADASSSWGEKAQRGFTAPHLGSSLSGAGSASGGAGASAGMSSFGSSNAQIGMGTTRGLHDDGSADKAVGGVAALRKIAAASQQAAANRSGDGAVASGSRIFDGAKAQGIGSPVGGAGSAAYAALDNAPANLKLNDPKLDAKEMKEPAAVDVPTAATDDTAKQLAMMAVTMIIGGAIGGTAGSMAMMMGQMMMTQQQSQAADARAKANQAKAAGNVSSQ